MECQMQIEIQIPEELWNSLQAYLERAPNWDVNRIAVAGLALMLMQNGQNDRVASRLYLDSIFGKRG
jgi:hypothetical protein